VLQLNQLDVVCVAGFVATSNVETVNDVRYVLMTPISCDGVVGFSPVLKRTCSSRRHAVVGLVLYVGCVVCVRTRTDATAVRSSLRGSKKYHD
jgi:hypothetical protein